MPTKPQKGRFFELCIYLGFAQSKSDPKGGNIQMVLFGEELSLLDQIRPRNLNFLLMSESSHFSAITIVPIVDSRLKQKN
jgi:hypothetical protein